MDEYSSPIGLTSQFNFCPNAFRVDMYKGCDFGCKYCFSNITNASGHQGFKEARIEKIKNVFYKAFETDCKENLTIELLRNRVPLHCGGKSDPFQSRESKLGLTRSLIEISNLYNYPICFSTKTAELPDSYFEILNPDIHAFQSSIIGLHDDYIKKWEINTPTAYERIKFVKNLRDKGFWCSIRIQPLIDIEEAEELVKYVGSIPSYITVEGLKLPFDNNSELKKLVKMVDSKVFIKSYTHKLKNIEIRQDIRKEYINRIKTIANGNGVLVGVGDNDLHHLSQSRCCCGIDTINDNFSNYLKYNLTYFCTGDCENVSKLFYPKSNVSECFYSGKGECRVLSYKENVDKYVSRFNSLLHNKSVEKQIFGTAKRKLF